MSDRYRKVRKALRAIKAHVQECEKLPNRAARRHAFYGEKMKGLAADLHRTKQEVFK